MHALVSIGENVSILTYFDNSNVHPNDTVCIGFLINKKLQFRSKPERNCYSFVTRTLIDVTNTIVFFSNKYTWKTAILQLKLNIL